MDGREGGGIEIRKMLRFMGKINYSTWVYLKGICSYAFTRIPKENSPPED